MSWYYSMSARARWELLVVIVTLIILVGLAVPAILHARAGVRDDLRRTDIANLKRALEQYNNKFNNYPTPPTGQAACTGSADKQSWLFGYTSPLVKNKFIAAIPHDLKESPSQQYRYCATPDGFFLETRLEIPQPAGLAFDEDENRKYNTRVLQENNQTLYRVCGGAETQCGTDSAH